MNKNFVETLVGAFVIIIAAVFLWFAYSTTEVKSTANAYKLLASFSRADGLSLGSDVKIGGIKVGKVTSLSIDHKTYQAIVELSVSSGIEVPADTTAEIVGDGLLGGKYLSLVPGSDPAMLKNGEKIEYTQSSISLEGLLGKYIFNGASKNAGDEKKGTDATK
ncbi:MAG: outer membrane lipid asymmetry maintenance protein MlaD [Rickettsiales bacterium]